MLALVLEERECGEMGSGYHLYLVYLFIEPLCLLTGLVSRALSTEAYCKVGQVKSHKLVHIVPCIQLTFI